MTADPCAAISEHGARSLRGQQPVAAGPTAAASRLACPAAATRPTSSIAAEHPAAAANKSVQPRQQRLAWAASLGTGRLPWLRVWGPQPGLQLWPELWAGLQPGAAATSIWPGMQVHASGRRSSHPCVNGGHWVADTGKNCHQRPHSRAVSCRSKVTNRQLAYITFIWLGITITI